jgi:hypothetical protein
VARTGEKKNTCRVTERKSGGKKSLRRPSCRWKGSVIMNLGEVGLGWTGFIWLRLSKSGGIFLNAVMLVYVLELLLRRLFVFVCFPVVTTHFGCIFTVW